MTHTKHTIAVAIAMLAASGAAFAQDTPSERERRNPVAATIEMFGLTDEQVDQIREIRRARPPRDQDRDQARAWREEQRAKIQGVLTDEQKAKVAELDKVRENMRAYAGAAMLGLTEAPNFDRGGRASRNMMRRDDRRPGGRKGFRGNSRGSGRGDRARRGKGRRGSGRNRY